MSWLHLIGYIFSLQSLSTVNIFFPRFIKHSLHLSFKSLGWYLPVFTRPGVSTTLYVIKHCSYLVNYPLSKFLQMVRGRINVCFCLRPWLIQTALMRKKTFEQGEDWLPDDNIRIYKKFESDLGWCIHDVTLKIQWDKNPCFSRWLQDNGRPQSVKGWSSEVCQIIFY